MFAKINKYTMPLTYTYTQCVVVSSRTKRRSLKNIIIMIIENNHSHCYTYSVYFCFYVCSLFSYFPV